VVGLRRQSGSRFERVWRFFRLRGSNISGSAFQTRYNFANGWFVGSERSGIGLGGMQQGAAFSNFGGLYTEGAQFGYSFKNASGLPSPSMAVSTPEIQYRYR